MATLHEISLLFGLVVSGLFGLQYRRYHAEVEEEEMMDSFLKP